MARKPRPTRRDPNKPTHGREPMSDGPLKEGRGVDERWEKGGPENAVHTPESYARRPEEHREPPHQPSLTSYTEEWLQSGVSPLRVPEEEIPGQDDLLRAGDPDVDPLENEYSGEEVPGGTTPTPDQGNVDDIGRVYGISDEDSGSLILGDDLIERRDRRRWELNPRSRDKER